MNKIKELLQLLSIRSLLSLIIVVVGIWYLKTALPNDDSKRSIENFILLVLGFHFGASHSGAKKDETIQTLSENASNSNSAPSQAINAAIHSVRLGILKGLAGNDPNFKETEYADLSAYTETEFNTLCDLYKKQ
jgi:hypothetical protein